VFLGNLPVTTRLVLMFGLGAKGNYVRETRKLVEKARPGRWRALKEITHKEQTTTPIAYTDGTESTRTSSKSRAASRCAA
jgi:hypothetical protein